MYTKNFLLFFVILLSFSSCFHKYYRTNTNYHPDSKEIEKAVEGNKYWILHTDDGITGLKNLRLEDKTIVAEPAGLTTQHSRNLNPEPSQKNRFRQKDRIEVLSEVHIYCNRKDILYGQVTRVPFQSITRMDIYNLDKKATSSSTILSIAGIVTGIGALGFLALLLAAPYLP